MMSEMLCRPYLWFCLAIPGLFNLYFIPTICTIVALLAYIGVYLVYEALFGSTNQRYQLSEEILFLHSCLIYKARICLLCHLPSKARWMFWPHCSSIKLSLKLCCHQTSFIGCGLNWQARMWQLVLTHCTILNICSLCLKQQQKKSYMPYYRT